MMHDKNSKKPTDREYFRAIDAAVRGEHLYRNPDLQRRDIIKRFGLRRQHLNLILEQYASGQSFPAYINSMEPGDFHILIGTSSADTPIDLPLKVR